MATGTPVFVSDTKGSGKIRKIKYSFTADGAGVFKSDAIPAEGGGVSGLFLGLETSPTAPGGSYNAQVRQGGSTTAFTDRLNGAGALRSTTLPEFAQPKDANGNATSIPVRGEDIFVTMDGLGALGTGAFVLWFLQEGS